MTRFLAVACFEGKISHAQAWQIEIARRRYLAVGMPPPKTGELAVEEAILQPGGVTWVLDRQEQYHREHRSLPDPLARPSRALIVSPHAIRIRLAGGAIILLSILCAWYLNDFNWGVAASAASVASGIWVAAENIWPKGLDRKVAWHRFFTAGLPGLVALVCLGYCIYVVNVMRRPPEGALPVVAALLDDLW